MAKKDLPKGPSPADLPDSELEILAYLWQHGPLTSRKIRDGLSGHRPMTHASMLSLLARLEERGFVGRKKGPADKAFVYGPTRRPEPTYRQLAQKLLDRVFGGSAPRLVLSLFEGRKPDREEIEQVRKVIEQLERSATA